MWDAAKGAANLRKHGVSFEQASALFSGAVDCLETYDEMHSDDEERFIAIGRVHGQVIVVVHTEREDDLVRIISARMATRHERGKYEEFEKAQRRQ